MNYCLRWKKSLEGKRILAGRGNCGEGLQAGWIVKKLKEGHVEGNLKLNLVYHLYMESKK